MYIHVLANVHGLNDFSCNSWQLHVLRTDVTKFVVMRLPPDVVVLSVIVGTVEKAMSEHPRLQATPVNTEEVSRSLQSH